MKDELLINNNFNVIIADWKNGADQTYTQATANSRLVGAMIARFIQLVQVYKCVKWLKKIKIFTKTQIFQLPGDLWLCP